MQKPIGEGKEGARRRGKGRKGRQEAIARKRTHWRGECLIRIQPVPYQKSGMIALALVDVTSELIGTLIVNSRADDNRAK